jgi:hypothetical protein
MHSDDRNVAFLHRVSTRAQPSNSEMKRIGSNTPLFRGAEQESLSSMLGGIAIAGEGGSGGGGVAVKTAPEEGTSEEFRQKETVRAAVHMDAMAFGMGCCCLQITFQAKDVDESRFIFDQLAVMAPM